MESIGGYQILRRLGAGSRSDVYLGHAGHDSGGEARLAAIKVFRPHVAEDSIDTEISALSRLSHAHIMRMLDLATGSRDVPCLILQRLEPGGLPRLLADRRELEAGEAVTILAPIIRAVAAMHSAGVVHGRLTAAAVLFDGNGAPVVSGFGAAESISEFGVPVTAARLDDDPRVARDREALATLALTVLGRVNTDNARVAELIDWLRVQRGSADACARLEHRLFEIELPIPVRFVTETRAHDVPHRVSPVGSKNLMERSSAVEPPDSAGTAWFGQWGLPPEVATWLGSQRARVPVWLVSGAAALPSAIRSIRRRVWVVAAVGVVAMTAAFILAQLPNDERTGSSVSSATEPGATPSATARTSVVTERDDPAAAAAALLELRARCLRDRSILCLDGVHAPGSSSWLADAARIHSIEAGGELAPDPLGSAGQISVTDLMGDTALLAVAPAGVHEADNAPASVLIIRTEAGWRFRSLLVGSSAVG